MITLDVLADLAALAYLLVLVLAAFDVVVPVLPSESAVILGGVLAWQGRLHPVPLILAAAAGAIAGDHLSYAIGRWTQRGRPQPHRRGDTARWARRSACSCGRPRQLDRRGPTLLIVARFIPGGRTASTFMAGRTAYPLSAVHAPGRRRGPAVGRRSPRCSATSAVRPSTSRRCWPPASACVLALGFAGLVELAMSRLERRRSRVAEAASGDAGDIAA